MKTLEEETSSFLPYGRQTIMPEDIQAIIEVLKSDWLTQGPKVPEFERELAAKTGAREVVACNSGTAALHLAMMALGIGPDDTVVTTPITFLASANCARYVGASVKFVDIDPSDALIDCEHLEQLLEKDRDRKIKAIIPVHFAGQPVDLPQIRSLADKHGAYIVDDACHAIGASLESGCEQLIVGGNRFSDATVFSFHPVKHIATGEGGAVATNDPTLANNLRLFRNHGLQKDNLANSEMAFDSEGELNPWYYEMQSVGYNYRLTDIQAALGICQLERLGKSVERRNELAGRYRHLIADRFDPDEVSPLKQRAGVTHAYHLFTLQIDFDRFKLDRANVMNRLREAGIGTQVHYIPLHLQPYYRQHCGTGEGDFPHAEAYYSKALSIPMFPAMVDSDCERVVDELESVLKGSQRG